MFFIWNTENCMKNYCFVLSWKLGLFLTMPNSPLGNPCQGLGSVRPQLSWWCPMWVLVARLHSNPGTRSSGAEVTNSCWHCEFNTTGQTLPSQGESFLLPQSSERPCQKFKLIWAQEAIRSARVWEICLGGMVWEFPLATGICRARDCSWEYTHTHIYVWNLWTRQLQVSEAFVWGWRKDCLSSY